MNLIDKTTQVLKKPFPDEESWASYLKNLTILSLFVTFFLYIFQPFGISTLESNIFLICLGFGSMTFAGAMIYEMSVGQLLRLTGIKAHWTFVKWILNIMGTMLFISLANFMFARISLFGYIEWDLLPTMVYATFMIGIIPVAVLGGIKMMQREKEYRAIADEFNERKSNDSSAMSHDNPTIFEIPANQIKYIEALQNYVKIGHVNAEGSLKIQTERITLKDVLARTEGGPIIKCHRSYLVNKDAIVSASGNAQGLLLTLSDCDKIIPVSRSCVPVFRNQ